MPPSGTFVLELPCRDFFSKQIGIAWISFYESLGQMTLDPRIGIVADSGVGDEAFTGMLASVGTIATAIGSFVFGNVYKKLKNAVYLPALFVMGICFVAMGLLPNPAVTIACVAIAGFFWPFYFCFFYTRCTELVPASKAGTATSIVALSDGLAAAGCSYLLTGLIGATGLTSVALWPTFGIVLFIVGAISIVWFVATRKKNAQVAEN